MPKTAVYQNHSVVLGKDKIRFARKRLTVESIAESTFVKSTPNDEFWTRIFAPDTRHHATANIWRYNVCQVAITCWLSNGLSELPVPMMA